MIEYLCYCSTKIGSLVEEVSCSIPGRVEPKSGTFVDNSHV